MKAPAGFVALSLLLLSGTPTEPLCAQTVTAGELTLRLAGMTAVTGYEQAMVDTLLTLLPGAVRDRAGNAVLVLGDGPPRRLAACPLDETGFAVGRVRADGWLTLRRSPARTHLPGPLFDQQLEGQRVTVFTARGPVPGVVAVRSVHLTRGRGSLSQEPFTVDDAYVDVGAASASRAADLGVGVLNPVALAKRPHRYGNDKLAAPWVGRRAACAALLAAARRSVAEPGKDSRSGSTVVAFVVEQQLSARGLLTLATSRGPFAESWIADDSVGARAVQAADSNPELGAVGSPPRAALGQIHAWQISTAYPGTAVETVSLEQVEHTSAAIAGWLRGEGGQ
jgi:putative aminopeptidase FrvX